MLREAFVLAGFRKRQAREQVVLVRRPYNLAAERAAEALLPLVHGLHGKSRLCGRVWSHRVLFGVAADAQRHDGHRLEFGKPVEDAGESPVQHRGVVHAGTDHHLAVNLDTVVQEAAQPPEADGPASVAQHGRADVGVGGVDRDVKGRQPLVDHPLEVHFRETRERREVAVEEREPVVVVLHVQVAPQPLGQLVDEAELAVVVASAHAVEDRGRDLEPERLTCLLDDRDLELDATADNLELDDRLVREQLVFDDIAGHLSVHRAELVARPDPATLSRRMLGHGHHLR